MSYKRINKTKSVKTSGSKKSTQQTISKPKTQSSILKEGYEKIEKINLERKPYYDIKDKITIKSGWISPDGKFFEVPFHQHGHVAEFLAEQFYGEESVMRLEDEGWLRFSSGYILAVVDRTKLGRRKIFSDKHIDMLYDFMIENNWDKMDVKIISKIGEEIDTRWDTIERKDLYEKLGRL